MKQSFKWGLIMSFVFLIGFSATILKGGVKVSVSNLTSSAISNVVLGFTGGSNSFSQIKPNQTRSARINPSSESGLICEYQDMAGSLYSTNIETYIEPGYRGSIAIRIAEDGRVTWTNNVKAFPKIF